MKLNRRAVAPSPAAFSLALAAFSLALAAAPVPAAAQTFRTIADHEWCDDSDDHDGHRTHCEVREATLPASGRIAVDAAPNGGVAVEGWDRAEVRVLAKVTAHSRRDDPKAVASEVTIEAGDTLRATGPSGGNREGWTVSYRLSVPRRSDLSLKSMNGGIHIEGVEGTIEFQTTNGGVHLSDLAGDVRGRTTNGGVDVRLDGTEWRGEGLDVTTSNGGVKLSVPEEYNAHLETGTVNGGMRLDFPLTVSGRVDRQVSADLGRGGATIRVKTTNGGVVLRRR